MGIYTELLGRGVTYDEVIRTAMNLVDLVGENEAHRVVKIARRELELAERRYDDRRACQLDPFRISMFYAEEPPK